MSTKAKWLLSALVALLVDVSLVKAQDAFVQSQSTSQTIKVTSCVVSSVRDKSIQQDCTSKASKACDGTPSCELPIGLNLTDGKDIDPVGVPMARRLGKVVVVQCQCGKTIEKRGPNPQNNNATLVLAC
jgi:hypothetical protein